MSTFSGAWITENSSIRISIRNIEQRTEGLPSTVTRLEMRLGSEELLKVLLTFQRAAS